MLVRVRVSDIPISRQSAHRLVNIARLDPDPEGDNPLALGAFEHPSSEG